MGGATVTILGNTPDEAERTLEKRRDEARQLGLVEEARTEPEYNEASQKWVVLVRFHK